MSKEKILDISEHEELARKVIKNYEVTCVFRSEKDLYQETKDIFLEKLKELDIVIKNEQDLGVRNFEFEIRKLKQGHYYTFYVQANPAKIHQLQFESVKHLDSLIRILIILREKKIYQKDFN